jgi:DnaJ-class molecular chaperone
MDQLTGGPWIQLYKVCPTCKGSGRLLEGGPPTACPDCHGNRKIPRDITLPELKKMLREAK